MSRKSETERLRDYGYGYTPVPVGVPQWTKTKPEKACPNCGAALCSIVVAVKGAMVKTEQADCRYLGCPACPFASPSVTTRR